ncbi:uncharacterized protein N7515_007945 [Penicillium bovifimosum]|uniref:Uncharacterized protein n=1 Tax=Penicillium bovifimosum TaxID=126998 RepID=A0A9W9KWW5_9EURO|nr:uncharacterized protein N7515_007945 [Penicillium bovifimosum]KAJ5124120.1 hypothetical protein N7515_007945 [Penicillium bovifimosum]
MGINGETIVCILAHPRGSMPVKVGHPSEDVHKVFDGEVVEEMTEQSLRLDDMSQVDLAGLDRSDYVLLRGQ